jgi:GxxExxY protein
MTENEISGIIVNTSFKIHSELGPGLLESIYEEILAYELTKKGLTVEVQKPIIVYWDDKKMSVGFKADIIVENKVIIELKSVKEVDDRNKKQLLTYLKITGLKLGLLINFNEALLKDGIIRIANGL